MILVVYCYHCHQAIPHWNTLNPYSDMESGNCNVMTTGVEEVMWHGMNGGDSGSETIKNVSFNLSWLCSRQWHHQRGPGWGQDRGSSGLCWHTPGPASDLRSAQINKHWPGSGELMVDRAPLPSHCPCPHSNPWNTTSNKHRSMVQKCYFVKTAVKTAKVNILLESNII